MLGVTCSKPFLQYGKVRIWFWWYLLYIVSIIDPSPDAFSGCFLDVSIQQNLQLTSHLPTTSHGHLLLQLLATRNRSLPRGPGLDSPGDHGKCAVLQINGRRSRCGGWIYANGGIMATRRSSFRSASESRLIRWSFVVCGSLWIWIMMFSKDTSWKIYLIFEGCLHFPTQKKTQNFPLISCLTIDQVYQVAIQCRNECTKSVWQRSMVYP